MFGNLIGNSPAKAALTRLVANGRVPHALLFAGPDGVGKKEFAFELARSFVCMSPVDGKACGSCAACHRVSVFDVPEPRSETKDYFKSVFFSQHTDVGLVVAYNRNILVDAIRDLEREANFRPYEARCRVFIIDEADRMNDAASNALLKTLEEPPDTTCLILVTSRPDTLLPTIRSRCQTVRFSPVSMEEIQRHLIESRGCSDDDAMLAAGLSLGSVGRAIAIELSDFRDRRDAMMTVLENALVLTDLGALLRSSETMNDAKNKDSFEDSLGILELLVRDTWLLKNGSYRAKLANIDIADRLGHFAEKASANRLAGWLDEIEELRQSLIVNINRRAATDSLFVTMAG